MRFDDAFNGFVGVAESPATDGERKLGQASRSPPSTGSTAPVT